MSEQGRVVVRYSGVQIEDCRERLRVVFTEPPRRGVRSALRYVGNFERQGDRIWHCPMSPAAVLQAQDIIGQFYGKETK